MFASSVVIVLQLIVYYAMRGGGFKAVIDGFVHKDVELGWGGPNNYSIILAMMTPATLYFAVKNGKYSPLYLIYAVVQYFSYLRRQAVARYFSARSDLSRRSALRFTKANSAAE